MKSMYFDKKSRTVADLVELSPDRYLITRINVPESHRGGGLASKLLKGILEEADEEGVALEVHPMASGGLSKRQLISWYGRYGFRPEDTLGVLVREPKVFGAEVRRQDSEQQLL